MDDLTKELENVNYRADYDYEASKAYRANTHDKLDAIAKSIDALTKKLGDYHKKSIDAHLILLARTQNADERIGENTKRLQWLEIDVTANTEQLTANTEQLTANTKQLKATEDLLDTHGWSLEEADNISYMRPGKLGGFEKKDVKDPVNLKL